MEMSVAAEGKPNELCTPISSSSTPLIKIDSISIDLVNGNEKMTDFGSCTHFSLRGYVAEVRKKQARRCWPFAIDDKINNPEDNTYTLPPLQAKKFRWWRCQSCVRETDPQGSSKEIEAVPKCTHTEAAGFQCNFQKTNRSKSLKGVLSSLIDKREKKVEVAHTTYIGHENVKMDNVNQEFPKPACDATESNPSFKLGRHTGTFESSCNGFVKTCITNCEINIAASDPVNTTNPDSQIKENKYVDDQNKELLTVCETSKLANSHASDDESYESDEILGRNNILDQLDDSPYFFNRQKPQKVRLLAEILVGNGNANTVSVTEDDGPSSASPGIDTFSGFRDLVARRESLGKGVKVQNKKRKMPSDGRFRSLEISSPNTENKKIRNSKGDFESADIAIVGAKSNKDASPETGKKKTKKILDNDRCFSLFPLQEAAHRKNEKKNQDFAETPLRCFLPAQGTEKKSSLFKKKNKRHQPENLKAFLMPWNNDLLRENLITGQNVETMQNGPKGMPYFCYENYLAAQEKNRNYFFGKDQITRKDDGKMYVGESSVPYNKSAADAFIDKEVCWDLSIKTGPNVTSLVHVKRNRPSQDVNEELSTPQKMDVFGKSNSEKPIKNKEKTEIVKKYDGRREDKVFEQGTATDDIPMEIVELLAKHQYEKRLHDARKVPPRNGEKVDLNKLRTDRETKSLLNENSHLQNSQLGNSRKNMFANGEDVGPIHQKTISDFPHMSLQEGSQISRGFQAFSQGQHIHVSNGVQFPATNSGKHNKSFPTSFHPYKAYDPCLTVPHHKPAGIRSSVTQNQTHYEPSTNIAQYYEPRANTLDVISQRLSTLQNGKINGNPNANFLKLSVGTCESQSRNCGARPINGKNEEHPYYPRGFGSADMYSADTIPAMHLLSLMDPGMGRSTPPFSADEKSKFLKSSHFLKNVCEQDMGLHKTTNHVTRQIPYVDYQKNSLSEKSCECYSSVPSFGALTTSIQNDISIRRVTTDFLGQTPVNSRRKGKAKRSYLPTKNSVSKSHKSASASTSVAFLDTDTNGGVRPVLNQEKRFLGASQLKHNQWEPQKLHGNVSLLPLKRRCTEMEICSVNRNPADFYVPGSGNMYMIGADDLKFKKRVWSRNVNQEKNQRLPMMSATKEKTRNKIQ